MLSFIIKLAHHSVVFLCLFIIVLINTLCGVFILHLSRKAKGCCMHVFSRKWITLVKLLELARNAFKYISLMWLFRVFHFRAKINHRLYTKYIFKFRENWLQDIRVQRPQKQRAQVKEGTGAKRGRKMNRG